MQTGFTATTGFNVILRYWTALHKGIKIIFIIALSLIIYGYFCRAADIYFFWESKSIGWCIFWIALLSAFIWEIKIRRKDDRNSTGAKIGIGVSAMVLLIKIIFPLMIADIQVCAKTKEYFMNDSTIRSEVGVVKSVYFEQNFDISESSDQKGEKGEATLNITVKGEKKYKDYYLHLIKNYDTGWQITELE